MPSISVYCDLILLFGRDRTIAFRTLIYASKEVFILGLVNELALVAEANAVMGAYLIDDRGGKVIADTVNLTGQFMAFCVGSYLDCQTEQTDVMA